MVEAVRSEMREKPVQSVERSLRILELLAEKGRPMSLSEISEMLNLKISTVHRLLKTLIMKGFAQQDPYTGKYQLGIKTFSIGNTALYTLDIRTVARPFLKRLETKYKETSNLAILDQGDVIYIDQVEAERMVKMIANLGRRAPSHSNAVGKVLLATLSDAELDRYFHNKPLTRFTLYTITSPEEFKKEIRKIRKNGYALDLEETEEGIRCVAAAIYDHQGKAVAAVGISGPSNRISLSYLEGELASAVLEVAGDISEQLGYLSSSSSSL